MGYLNRYTALILGTSTILSGLGIMVLYSVAPGFGQTQLFITGIGAVIVILISRLDYRLYTFSPWPWYLLANLLLLITLILGAATHGVVRWVSIGGISLQTSEIAKPLVIIFMAVYVSQYPINSLKSVFVYMLWLSAPLSLILLQPNLGTASILGLLAIVSLVVSGVSIRKLVLLSSIGLIMLPVLWTIMRPYQRERIYSFINPSSDPQGTGYNALQAQIAIGSGKLFGRGLGQGTQSHLRFLPERYSDFIYSSLVEELGFIGGSITIGVFITLVLALVVASKHTDSDIASLMLLLSSSLILIQAFINIGMNIGILPITGITLPLMSAGGSSLLSTAVILGMCVGITQQISVRKPKLELH